MLTVGEGGHGAIVLGFCGMGHWRGLKRERQSVVRGRKRLVWKGCTVSSESGKWFYRRAGPKVSVDGAEGEGKGMLEGRTLLMLHPNFLHGEVFTPQLEGLSKYVDVVACDLRGHGKSEPPEEDVEYTHADQLDEFLNSLGLESVDLLGVEMGGAVALDFADTYPDRVNSLILANPSAFLHAFPASSFFNVTQAMSRGGTEECKSQWLRRPDFNFTRMNKPVFWFIEQLIAEYDGWHFEKNDKMQVKGGGIDHYYSIEKRTLIMTGEHCGQDFRQIASLLNKRLKNATDVVELIDTGMLPNLERVNAFNDVVLDFLKHTVAAEIE